MSNSRTHKVPHPPPLPFSGSIALTLDGSICIYGVLDIPLHPFPQHQNYTYRLRFVLLVPRVHHYLYLCTSMWLFIWYDVIMFTSAKWVQVFTVFRMLCFLSLGLNLCQSVHILKHAFPPSRAIFEIVMDKIRKTPYPVPRTKHTPFPWLPLDCIAFHGFPDRRRVLEGKTRFYIWLSLGGINEGPRVQLRIKDNRCMHVRIDDWRKEKERV